MKPEIKEAADRCRAAFAEYPNATHTWCCHHEIFYEQLTEPAENRIQFILKNKIESEQINRLNNFRPVQDWPGRLAPLDADYDAKRAPLYADYEAKRDTLDADYDAKRAPLYADYEAKRDTLYADYDAKRAALYADYEAKRAPLYADYDAKRAALYADYEAKRDTLMKPIKKLYKQEVPLGTWNGKSIFK